MEDTQTMETLQEETIPNAEGTSETAEAKENATSSQGADSQAEQSETVADNTEGVQNEADNDFLPVKFLHEERTLNREDAIRYAQMGMNYERFEPMIAKLDYLAAVQGVTRDEYIEGQLKNQEDAMRKSIIEKFGDDEKTINEMMEFKKQKHQKAYDDMIAKAKADEKTAEENTEARLATEFAGLVSEFPELEGKSFKDLPKEVKQAGFKGENLLNAYLLHQHREAKNIAAAQKQSETAAKKSTGSMGTDNGAQAAPDAFLEGLFGR